VAEHHPAVRAGLRDYIETDPGLAVVAEATDARETLMQVGEQRPDVLVLDMRIPGMPCIEVLHKSKKAYPPVHILVLALACDAPYASALLRAGADGCLAKNVDCDQFVRVVMSLAHGERAIDGHIGARAASQLASRSSERTQGRWAYPGPLPRDAKEVAK
jgi:DNA-binding NarL/FixJ family response regulator